MNHGAPEIVMAKGVIQIDTEGLDKAEEQVDRLTEKLGKLAAPVSVEVGGDGASVRGDGESNELVDAIRSLSVDLAQLRQSIEDLAVKMEGANTHQE